MQLPETLRSVSDLVDWSDVVTAGVSAAIGFAAASALHYFRTWRKTARVSRAVNDVIAQSLHFALLQASRCDSWFKRPLPEGMVDVVDEHVTEEVRRYLQSINFASFDAFYETDRLGMFRLKEAAAIIKYVQAVKAIVSGWVPPKPDIEADPELRAYEGAIRQPYRSILQALQECVDRGQIDMKRTLRLSRGLSRDDIEVIKRNWAG